MGMNKVIIANILTICILFLCSCAKDDRKEYNQLSDMVTTTPETKNEKEGMTLLHGDWVAEKRDVSIEKRKYRYIKYRIKPTNEIVIDSIETAEKELIIPQQINGYPVKEIGNSETERSEECIVVKGQNKFTQIVIPEGIELIGTSAFEKVASEKLLLPSTLKEIGEYAFFQSNIPNVKAKGENISLKYCAFAKSELKNIELPHDFSGRFGISCFEGSALEKIRWPQYRKADGINLQSDYPVEIGVFQNCKNLKKVIFPEKQEFIKFESGLFNGCENLQKLVFPATTQKVLFGAQIYSDNNKKKGPKLVFCGKETEWQGVRYPSGEEVKKDGKSILTVRTVEAPQNSRAYKKAKASLRVSWLSRSFIRHAMEERMPDDITEWGEKHIQFQPLI